MLMPTNAAADVSACSSYDNNTGTTCNSFWLADPNNCTVNAPLALAGTERLAEVPSTATLHEAEYFYARGHRDLFYAVTIEPGKFARTAALLRAGAKLTVACDDPATGAALATNNQSDFSVFIPHGLVLA